MKTLTKKLWSILLMSITLTAVHAQDSEYRKFGMGMSFSPFNMTSMTGNVAVLPISSINFAYNVTSVFRMEGDLGFTSIDLKTEEETMGMTSFGMGFFYTKRNASSVLMGGWKFEYLSGLTESNTGTSQDSETEVTRLSYGPALAYEHLFGKHFGLGAETGLRVSTYDEVTKVPGLPESEYQVDAFFVHNLIFLRGYF
jgi:hypothetical protein